MSTLRQHDGSDPAKPIYVAIKGNVYDVTAKKEMYGPGQGYNVFAGRDASRGLGMSSLEVKDAVADYSTLDDKQMKTLDHWESFFQKVRAGGAADHSATTLLARWCRDAGVVG